MTSCAARAASISSLPGVTPSDLSAGPKGEPSASVAARVARARAAQRARFEEEGATLRTNAELQGDLLDRLASPDAEGRALLDRAAEIKHGRVAMAAFGPARTPCSNP